MCRTIWLAIALVAFGQSSGPALADSAASIAGGQYHNCVVTETGVAKCWGENFFGQLGDGTYADRPNPTNVRKLGTAAMIATDGGNSCAVTSDGTARCWGRNDWGELGDGTRTGRPLPGPVRRLSGVTAIASKGEHSCAAISSGRAMCWGDNAFGQIGDGTRETRLTAVAAKKLAGVVALALGITHSCALTNLGTVYCWGATRPASLATARQSAACSRAWYRISTGSPPSLPAIITPVRRPARVGSSAGAITRPASLAMGRR